VTDDGVVGVVAGRETENVTEAEKENAIEAEKESAIEAGREIGAEKEKEVESEKEVLTGAVVVKRNLEVNQLFARPKRTFNGNKMQ
jgi:hypothetical protein